MTRVHLQHAIVLRLHVHKIKGVILTPEAAVTVGVWTVAHPDRYEFPFRTKPQVFHIQVALAGNQEGCIEFAVLWGRPTAPRATADQEKGYFYLRSINGDPWRWDFLSRMKPSRAKGGCGLLAPLTGNTNSDPYQSMWEKATTHAALVGTRTSKRLTFPSANPLAIRRSHHESPQKMHGTISPGLGI